MGIWLLSVPERWGIWKESSSLSMRIHVFYLLIWRSFKVNSSLSWAIDSEKKVFAKVLVIVWKVTFGGFAFYMKNWLLTLFTLTSVCIQSKTLISCSGSIIKVKNFFFFFFFFPNSELKIKTYEIFRPYFDRTSSVNDMNVKKDEF